jgi:hypothetical protein
MQHLQGLTNLETLAINGTAVGNAGLAVLKPCKGLRDLNLQDTKVNDDGMAHLAELTNLETLNISNNREITNEGVKHLANLPKLKKVILFNTRTTVGIFTGRSKELPNVEIER